MTAARPRPTARAAAGAVLVVVVGALGAVPAAGQAGSAAADAAPAAVLAAATPPPAPSPPRAVVSIGDSIPEGDDCPGCTPFPDLLGRALGGPTGAAVPVTNLGVGGWTTSDLLTSVTADPAATSDVDAAIAAADVVTVTIGANDLYAVLDDVADGACGGDDGLACTADVLPAVRANLAAVLADVHSLRAGAPTTVLVTGYWDVYPGGDVGAGTYGPDFLAASAAVTRATNAVIAATTAAAGDTYVDLAGPFAAAAAPSGDLTPLLTDDGDHASQRGDQVITDALTAALPAGTG